MTSRVIGRATALVVSLALGSILAGCGSQEPSAEPPADEPATTGPTTSPTPTVDPPLAGVEPADGPVYTTYSTRFRLLAGWRPDELSTEGQMVAGDRLGPRTLLMRDWPAPMPIDRAAAATLRERRGEGRFRRLEDLEIPGCTAFQVAGREAARDTFVVAVGCPVDDRDLYFEFKERGGTLEGVQEWMHRVLATLEHR